MYKEITHINFAKGFRGGERQTQLLIEELSKNNFKQTLLLRKGSELTKRCKDIPNLEIIEISKPYILHINKIKKSKLIHAHETKALQFAFFTKILKGIPYIVTRRVDNKIKNNFLNELMYNHANKVIALSNAIKDGIEDITQQADITIVPSAFNPSIKNDIEIKRLKEKFSGKFIIGHIGALDDKHKGQTIIINLAKSLQTKYPDILFLLLGTGDDEQYLKNLAKGLNNVVFEGFVHNVIDYIAIFDIFLFPSRNEGLGSTLLDVIEGEVCIVASDVGGIPDIITNDKTGILFDINNQEKLEEIIISLYHDKEKCQTLTLEAKKSIDKYSVETMCKSYIDIYKNIINPT